MPYEAAFEIRETSATLAVVKFDRSSGDCRLLEPRDPNSYRRYFGWLKIACALLWLCSSGPLKSEPQGAVSDPATIIRLENGKVLHLKPASPGDRGYVTLNGKEIYGSDEEYMSLKHLISLGETFVLICATNPGGAGTYNQYFAVTIPASGEPSKVAVPSGNQEPKITITENAVRFDMGFDAGVPVRAILSGGKLSVSRSKRPSRAALDPKECAELYTEVLEACANSKPQSCTRSDLVDMLGMSMVRQLIKAEQNPGFNQRQFERFCRHACSTRRRSTEGEFRASVCLQTGLKSSSIDGVLYGLQSPGQGAIARPATQRRPAHLSFRA